MGANGDAGVLIVGDGRGSGARHADRPVQLPCSDSPALVRDHPSRIGTLDIRVHLTRVDPEVQTKVNAEDLPSDPAVTLRAMCIPAQAICLLSSKTPAPVATRTLDDLKDGRPPVGR